MTELGRCRLLRHEPGTAAWNMAVDEMLWQRIQVQPEPCLRLYQWSEPTISLGTSRIMPIGIIIFQVCHVRSCGG